MNGCDPLLPDDYVLRRISACNVDERSMDQVIPWSHFTPTKDDTDGLSLTRATAKTPEQMVEGLKNKCGYYVARFQVRELTAIGFTLVPTEHIAPGHVSIPELNYASYKANKAVTRIKLDRLAELAWQRIVLKSPPLL